MLGARVISDQNVQENAGDEQQQQTAETGDNANNSHNYGSPSQPAAMIEPDNDPTEYSDHDAPLDLISPPNRNVSDDAFTTSSSLSDASEGNKSQNLVDVDMEDVFAYEGSPTPLAGVGSGPYLNQHPPTHYQQHLQPKQQRLQRMDSTPSDDSGSGRGATTTSQNSSRDWGWFEDVHQSGQLTPTGSLTNRTTRRHPDENGHKNASGKSKKSIPHRIGLDPNNETAAAAMAVTAPTYVLEESLSSQRLWKYTAGNRPPQPMEERMFYEKMWAQNFARSQVNYQMPVDVLTATSPISLSPFAEGTMEMSAAAAADGGDYNQYTIGMNTPANTHNMMMPSSRTAAGGNSRPEETSGGAKSESRSGLKEAPRPAAPAVLPPMAHQDIVNKVAKTESGDNLRVLVRGDNVFGTTVSKSFACTDERGGPITGVDTVNISVASYRVVDSQKNGKYAQFLVIYREGSIRDTIGVWKRYSDFDDLAKKVTQAHEGCASVIANMSPLAITEEHDVEHLPNAITSWRLLKKRQRWYRCLDAGYLSLKVFLLERFLHDILFESSSPKLLREFVGADQSLSR
ncbi:expressed unknown protein [Seminavis robusta]|uniref:Uncharacterized protein n=1 Tax=Seminavis robusta TaxID=568900 RepID=A0A9N8HF73_9STRA|nr:expressed unknown protein [Seminavis robusta]|eukprot:Sro421_g139430.1 n/a (571) ;mRNA; f:2161-4225